MEIDPEFLKMAKKSINKDKPHSDSAPKSENPQIEESKDKAKLEQKKVEAYAVVDAVFMCDCTG